MAYPILGTPNPQFLDSSGAPYASGTLTTLDPADGSTIKACYPTADNADAGTNGVSADITLDASGRVSTGYWGKDGEDYKVVLKDSSGSTVLTMDDIDLPMRSRRATITLTTSDATPTVAEGSMFEGNTNISSITDFDDGQVGDIIHLFCDCTGTDTTRVQSNTAIRLNDDLDFSMRQNDTLTLAMFEDQVWHEVGRSQRRSDTLTTATTLTEGDTGRTYFLDTAGGFTVTLPAATAGVRFTFVVQTAPTTAYIIAVPSAGTLYGVAIDITATKIGTVEDQINFVASTSVVGDRADFISDGTNWYAQTYSGATDGITFTT